jgi:hypothetical protein
MVGGALARASTLRVDLGVGGPVIVSGSLTRPSDSCDGWVCDLGVVCASWIFGLVRGSGVFDVVIPTFVFVSRMKVAQQYRDYDQFLSVVSSSRHESMDDDTLVRTSTLCVGLGVSGATSVSGSCARPLHLWISLLLTSSLSLDISSLFCRATQCM